MQGICDPKEVTNHRLRTADLWHDAKTVGASALHWLCAIDDVLPPESSSYYSASPTDRRMPQHEMGLLRCIF